MLFSISHEDCQAKLKVRMKGIRASPLLCIVVWVQPNNVFNQRLKGARAINCLMLHVVIPLSLGNSGVQKSELMAFRPRLTLMGATFITKRRHKGG